MLENVALVQTLSGQNIANNQLQYPIQPAEKNDVLRFQLEIEGSNKALPPIFQAIDKKDNISSSSNGDLMSQIRNVDANYHNILMGMNNLSNNVSELDFKSISQKNEGDFALRTPQDIEPLRNSDFVRTPDDVSEQKVFGARELLDIQKENQTKALETMRNMTSWTIRAQMYFSNIKIIGSAITQVSQGFKTLFRSSG